MSLKQILCLLFMVCGFFRQADAEQVDDFIKVSALINLESAQQVNIASSKAHEGRVVVSVPLELDLKTLTGSELGLVSVQGLIIEEALGAKGKLLEDAHAYSNLRAEDRVEIFELFWEKSWSKITVRIGKLDANNHFAVSEHEALLINGASGYSPSIFGMPSYPDSAWSTQIAYHSSRLDLLTGVFDGGSTIVHPTPTGARLWLSPSAYEGGLFWVAQATTHLGKLHTEQELPSTENLLNPQQNRAFVARAPLHLTLGAWTHRGEVYPQKDLEAPGLPSWGFYMTGDYTLIRFTHGSELGLGLQAAISPHYHPLHLSTALTWTDLFQPIAWAKAGPSVALGLSYLSLSSELTALEFAHHERLVECTMALPLSPSLATSLSWMMLHGEHFTGQTVQLVVARVLLGAL